MESCPAKTAYWGSDEGCRMVGSCCRRVGRVRVVEHPDGWSGNGKGSLVLPYHLNFFNKSVTLLTGVLLHKLEQ